VELDGNRNRTARGEGAISAENSAVKIWIIPANEEVIVARETAAVVNREMAVGQAK
jgi:acetate kinase